MGINTPVTAASLINGGFTSGRYYGGATGNVHSGGVGLSANQLRAVPVYIPKNCVLSGIAIEVTQTGAGTLARLGIYDIIDGVPTNLIVDAGTVAVNSTGTKEASITQPIKAGLYAFCVVANGGFTISGIDTGDGIQVMYTMGKPNLTGNGDKDWWVSHTFGALPSTFGTPGYDNKAIGFGFRV